MSWLTRLFSKPRDKHDDTAAPFPYRQLFVLALCRICEPIAFMSIFPYIYYMIKSFEITSDDQTIALYAGMVTSAFAFAEFLAGVAWGRLSDKFGRKPILLCGLAGTGISMIVFGFSKSLPMALIARALGGLLNGNIGVLQTTVAEVVTVEAHRPLGFSIMPVVWCVGSIVGSVLGGALADPVRNYGWSDDTIWATYPFLLPNLVCTGVVIFGMIIGIFFLEETHEDMKHRRDYGVELGRVLMRTFQKSAAMTLSCKQTSKTSLTREAYVRLPEDDGPPDYRSAESSPQLSPAFGAVGLPPPAYKSTETSPRHSLSSAEDLSLDVEHDIPDEEAVTAKPDISIKSAFSRQVILNIVSYGILAYHTISTEQLLPVLFSMPENSDPKQPPFFFTGGFGWQTKFIGGILSVQGLIQVVATLLAFPPISRRLGSLRLFRWTAYSFPFLYLLVPYLTLLPTSLRMVCVYLILVWKVTAAAFTYPSVQIMLVNSAPSTKVLGTINGAAASSASLSRAIGPTVSGLVQSAGLAHGILGLPWWVNALIAFLGVVISAFMTDERMAPIASEKQNRVDVSNDATAAEPLLNDRTEPSPSSPAELPNANLETMQATPTSPIIERRGSVPTLLTK